LILPFVGVFRLIEHLSNAVFMCIIAANVRQRLGQEDRLRSAMDRFVRARSSGLSVVKKSPEVAAATGESGESGQATPQSGK
jgi:hypothetical protein